MTKRMLIIIIMATILLFDCIKCANMIETGCWAYDCKRTCLNSNNVLQTPGDNGFRFEIQGTRDNKYVPDRIYKVSLVGSYNSLRNSYTDFRGFLIVSVPENWYDAIPFNPIGRFMINPNDREIKYASGCSEMITHTNFESKRMITFFWNAPKAGSGCISFKAVVLQTDTLWFKDDAQLTKTLCEEEEYEDKNEIKKCCACGEAKYSLNFKGTWTKQTHPKDWPTNEGLTHWSNIIGAVHSRNYTVWEYGGYATPGLKELAEFGIIRTLEEEIKNHSNYGVIRNIVRANGLWFPNVDKETNSVFTVSNNHHLLSFATMLGPSPDWLSGLSKLDLCREDCTWIEEHTEDLYPFDAGTDSGLSYNSPNKPTVPQEKIRKISSTYPNNVKNPFYDPSGKPMLPVAKLTIKRTMLRGEQCPNGIKQNSILNKVDQKDFDLNDLSDPIRRLQIINTESVSFAKKRTGIKQMKFIEQADSRCMTSEWTEWSPCSSTCGKGLRKRSRQYKDEKLAMGVCNEILDDNEMCLSENGECDFDQEETQMDQQDMCLMMSSWSVWSPCSTTCGKGTTIRLRSYLKKELESKCNNKLIETKSCVVSERCINENLLSDQERKRICSLDKKPGPCRMTLNNTRYYFDQNLKRCLPFEYGGCRGNENNFEQREKCERICSIMNEENPNEKKANIVNHLSQNEIAERKKTCLLPPEEGHCYESLIKYRFDRTKLTCLPFEYSGCGGNTNNFNTLLACQSTCNPIIDLITPDEMPSMKGMKLTMPEKKKICMSPAEKGTCSDSIQRYTYSVNMGKCLLFEYSGCEGNLNNFQTIEECESVCDILIQMSQQAAANEEEANLEIQKKEMCMQPRENGPCMNYQERYYFDTTSGKCEKFTFGGCNGNDNNFESLDECESTCHALIESASNTKSISINMEPQVMSYHERKTICKYPVNEGSCNQYLKRYYFNFFLKDCEPFAYTGCDGNENNFLTYENCMKTCADLEKNYTAEALSRAGQSNIDIMMYPVNCRISEWSSWSQCSETECAKKGYSYRTRTILSEQKYGGLECPKNLNETKICFKRCSKNVASKSNNEDCVVGSWSVWGECKMGNTCNDGYQERSRIVIRNKVNNGKDCPILKEKRRCYLGPCNQKN